jgi:hypothetical protein
MIDWTQPIETTETPPRPVRVLATDLPNTQFPVCVAFDGSDGTLTPRYTLDGRPDLNSIRPTLRNVAPHKSQPMRHSLWVRLFYDGTYDVPISERPHQLIYDDSFFVEVPWMSDGSPVPGEDDPVRYGVCETCVERSVKRCDELVAERDRWKAECEHWAGTSSSWIFERDALKAEVERLKARHTEDGTQIEYLHASISALKDEMERLNKANLRLLGEIARMRPVVEAAVAIESAHIGHLALNKLCTELGRAVRAYQSTPKKTAEQAVANVAAMMGPVKTCHNCRHDTKGGICAVEGPFGFDDNNDCQDWEMKNG